MSSTRYDKEIIRILEQQVIPWWEQSGASRLTATTETQAAFEAQPAAKYLRVNAKKRRGKRVAARGPRFFDNTSYGVESWPDDRQRAIRYPTLTCILKGQADFHIADYLIQIPQGNFLLLSPFIPYSDGSLPHFEGDTTSRYCEVLWFLAPPGKTNRIACWVCYSDGDAHRQHQLFDFCFLERAEILTLFNLFLTEITDPSKAARKIAEASFLAFLRLFVRELRHGRFSLAGDGSTVEQEEHYSTPVEMALQHINNNLGQRLTTASVARTVFMSRSRFIQQFQLTTGQNFSEYLTQRRLDEAKRLLTEGNWSISVICRFVGLSPAQLRNLFNKHFSLSPIQYRARFGKKDDVSD